MADDKPISPSDAIFARAYANAIKTKFHLDLGEHLQLHTSAVTQRGMAAGDLISPQLTNYLTYKLADALQYSDNPTYTGGSAGSYLQQLRSYIEWVKTKGNPSQSVVDRMNKAREVATSTNTKYSKYLEEAQYQYNRVKELYPNLTFWQWFNYGNYPPLGAAVTERKYMLKNFYSAMQPYYGPDASTLETYHDNITNAQSPDPRPGLNQDGLIDDQDIIANAVKNANNGVQPNQEDITQSTIPVPAYSASTYVNGVQAWINAAGRGAPRDEVITIDIYEGRNTTWEDYGFKEVRRGGGAGFWPFFSAEVNVGGRWESRTLDTSGREDSISIQLAMIGIQKFDIQPGNWDIPNVKALFPNRDPGAPDALSSDYARIVSVIVGYDVELRVGFASRLRKEVDKIYEEVKSTGGRMSIFGFRVSAGAGGGSAESVETKFEDVKWDKSSGSMTLTPTKCQVYPTILAVVAQRFD